MQIIGASWLWVCDPNFSILQNSGLLIQEGHIARVGDYAHLVDSHPKALSVFYPHCVLLPALINPHVHFEFSNQQDSFAYGSFEAWLTSVIQQRDRVLRHSHKSIQQAIAEQLKSGVASVGAISSYGLDRTLLANSPLRVVFFDELLGGSAPIEPALQTFQERHALSLQHKSPTFTPAIAIHAPYSVHKDLAKKVLSTIKSPVISAHFLESQAELEWLEQQKGWFARFYTDILGVPNPKPLYHSVAEFLDLFKNQRLLLVHGLFAKEEHLKYAKKTAQLTLISCPRSNRLLSGQVLDPTPLKKLGIPLSIATDGKSSNYNLDFLEELRTALFAYQAPLKELAIQLILSATWHAAQALGLNNGSLQAGKLADLAIFSFKGKGTPADALNWLLHAKKAKVVYVGGKLVIWQAKN
ncbi:aminofutalosine deaminase family hydrolase [Helicobacter mehlei]|nr:aminofutalosine deaminase family hydrolase [Helicobacter mehlei]